MMLLAAVKKILAATIHVAMPMSTARERERHRKAQLVAMGVLITFLWSFPLFVFFVVNYWGTLGPVLVLGFEMMLVVVFWLNRRGALQVAAFTYHLGYLFVVTSGLLSSMHDHPSHPQWLLWEWLPLATTIIISGLVFAPWVPFFFAALTLGIMAALYSGAIGGITPLAFLSPVAGGQFWTYVVVFVLSLAVIGALYSWSTYRAVLLADRAEEFRYLHGELQAKTDQLQEANAKLLALATIDPITQVINHRGLLEALQQTLAQSQRERQPFAVLFVDLDHFKALNDACGHGGGDQALQEMARRAQNTIRQHDTFGRWGGEEFVAVLPGAALSDAVSVAEALRLAVAARPFAIGSGVQITCSVGVAAFPEHGTTVATLVAAADQAMYGAKQSGRNQVCHASDPQVQALAKAGSAAGTREEELLQGIVAGFLLLMDARDPALGRHARRVGQMAEAFAGVLGMPAPAAHMLSIAGCLHDLGKVVLQSPAHCHRIDDATNALDEQREQAGLSANVLTAIPLLRPFAAIISAQYEHWDGSGDPEGLCGEVIPLGARILAIIDAYDAVASATDDRALARYDAACDTLRHLAGSQLDPALVQQFLATSWHAQQQAA